MTKGRMLHGILPFFCAGAALLLRSRVRSSNSAAAVGVQTHRAAEVGHGLVSSDLLRRLGCRRHTSTCFSFFFAMTGFVSTVS